MSEGKKLASPIADQARTRELQCELRNEQKRGSVMWKYLAALLVGLAILVSGCIAGVGWLPDSSGFVFTTARGDLILYDIATKTQTVLMHDRAAFTTSWPTVSSDGKRIALGEMRGSGNGFEVILRIKVCDLKGRVKFTSDPITYSTEPRRTVGRMNFITQVFWSPDDKKLLVYCHGGADQVQGFDGTLLFDLSSGEFKKWAEYAPACFSGTPVRPDGQGFLLAHSDNNDYKWVDWNGDQKPITQPARFSLAGLLSTALLDAQWYGNQAILNLPGEGGGIGATSSARIVIDTDQLDLAITAIPEDETRIGEEIIHKKMVLDSGVELLLLTRAPSNVGAMSPVMRLVAREAEEAPLNELVPPMADHMVWLDLSPDKTHALFRACRGPRGNEADVIYVINNSGELHDTITVKERGPSVWYEDR